MDVKSKYFWAAVFTVEVIILISESKGCDKYDYSTGGVDTIPNDDVESGSEVHVGSWSGHLSARAQNFTTLTIEWDAPTGQVILCTYVVHYYPASKIADKTYRLVYYVPRNKTDMVLTNLTPGTSYHIYVEAVFDKPVPDSLEPLQILKSMRLVASTRGFGSEENPCNCDPKGTENNDVNNCDLYTGQCRCKSKQLTSGLHCDKCAEFAYMNDEFGCAACDQCSTVGSYGTCKPAPHGKMNCNCKEGFMEPHCSECHFGYYPVGDHCVKCNCSGNEKKIEGHNWCTANGTCISCDFHTAGDHCEICYDGFSGNASLQTCSLPSSAVPSSAGHRVGIAILVIIFVVLIIAATLFGARRIARRRRQRQFKQTSSDGINFTALEEEPDIRFSSGDRKLQFGSMPSA